MDFLQVPGSKGLAEGWSVPLSSLNHLINVGTKYLFDHKPQSRIVTISMFTLVSRVTLAPVSL